MLGGIDVRIGIRYTLQVCLGKVLRVVYLLALNFCFFWCS